MKKAVLYVSEHYLENRIFDVDDKVTNRDNCLFHWNVLKNKLREKNINFSTQDINPIEASDLVIYSDMPEVAAINKDKINYLVLFESELIRPDNWIKENHIYFNKIFTWNNDWVDNKSYIQFYLPNKIENHIDYNYKDKKLCTMISGNKFCYHKNELYSERLKAIEWFEKYHLNEFDLYGMGWDRKVFTGKFTRKFNRFKPLVNILLKDRISYKGKVESKLKVLKKYKFAICYENGRNIPGYITEKIFDCFFAGCIPIYIGAPNINDYIPEETYINRDRFKSYEELYKYLTEMTNEQYVSYLQAIDHFLSSDEVKLFSAENFSDIFCKEIIKDLK